MSKHTKPLVLQLITQAEFGGAQKYVYDVAQNIGDSFDVVVAAGELDKSRELLDRLGELSISVRSLDKVVRSISLFRDIAGFRQLVKIIDELRPDIIHLNASKMSILGSLAAHFVSRKRCKDVTPYQPLVIYTAHGWVFSEKISRARKAFYIWAERITARYKDTIIVLSHIDKELAHEHGIFPRKNIVVIPNGLDIAASEFFSKTGARQRLAEHARSSHLKPFNTHAFIIGTVANLYPNKGLHYLLEAATHVKQQLADTGLDKPFQIVIIGDGLLREELMTTTIECGLEADVLLLGRVKDAYRYMKALDLFVLPSLKEGIPFVLLEAMNAQLPIIASDVGAVSEVIRHEKDGLLIPPADALLLAEHMHELMHHPEIREKMAESGYARVKKYFSSHSMTDALKRVYTGS